MCVWAQWVKVLLLTLIPEFDTEYPHGGMRADSYKHSMA